MKYKTSLLILTLVTSFFALNSFAEDTATSADSPDSGSAVKKIEKDVRHHQNAMDIDNDGKVSKKEYMDYMEKKFSQIDANSDGYLTNEERNEFNKKYKNRKKHKSESGTEDQSHE